MTELLRFEMLKSNVALVTLNNPPLNIITLEMTGALIETFEQIEIDDSVRAAVITGAGNRAFSAGADVKEFAAVRDRVIEKKLARENEAFRKIALLSKPVIAAIEGMALGGGSELSLACDIRIMSTETKMGFPEIKLGVFPGSGGLYRLPKLVGMAKAVELMYTGDLISAEEAYRIGLVNRVAQSGEVLKEAIRLAETLATRPKEALKAIKQGVRESYVSTYEEALKLNLDLSDMVFKTEDCGEGINAFFEKREPRFK